MTSLVSEQPVQWLGDAPLVANTIRVGIIFVGFTLAMIAAKIGLRAARYRDWERTFGTISFAFIVATPSVSTLFRFDEPLNALVTILYLCGLLAGVVATAFRVTLRFPRWRRRRARRRAARH